MRRRLQSPLFPLFQVHVERWILNILHILCFSETIHHLYICRWNWIVVRGVSCRLWGDLVQTPPHTSIKTSRQVTVHSYYPSVFRLFAEISVRQTPQKYCRLDIPASLWHLQLSIFFGASEWSRTKYVSLEPMTTYWNRRLPFLWKKHWLIISF